MQKLSLKNDGTSVHFEQIFVLYQSQRLDFFVDTEKQNQLRFNCIIPDPLFDMGSLTKRMWNIRGECECVEGGFYMVLYH